MSVAIVKYDQGKMQHKIEVGSHKLISDISEKEGGENHGPSPHDYLAVALAACTSMTLRMYATRKAWPLESADSTVTLNQQKDVTKFEIRIHLSGDLSPEQKDRLLEIAQHCPVHRALSGKIEITTSLID